MWNLFTTLALVGIVIISADVLTGSWSVVSPLCGNEYAVGNEMTYTFGDIDKPLCIFIGTNASSPTAVKYLFYPTVDRFTLLNIKGCTFKFLVSSLFV